jgi:hypothetical protein
MTTQFQVGQEYKINAVEFITVSRRTEVSVWFIQNSKEIRRKIQISGYGENKVEFVNFQDRSLYAIKTTVTSNCEVTHTEPKVKSLIVCDREAISDVVYSELIEAFNLKDDECLPAWCGFYRYEKPKKSMTEPCVYFVFYEHVNGRSGGNYQVKVTFDEPCTI